MYMEGQKKNDLMESYSRLKNREALSEKTPYSL